MDNKICIKCKQEFSLDYFYKNRKYNRYHSYCKKCCLEYNKNRVNKKYPSSRKIYMENNDLEKLEKLRIADKKYQRKKRKLNKEKKRLENINYIKNNPEKIKAIKKLNFYIKKGKIVRCKCRDCDRIDTHGHHPDYSKPLEVIWLCPSHHKLEHLKLNKKRLDKL